MVTTARPSTSSVSHAQRRIQARRIQARVGTWRGGRRGIGRRSRILGLVHEPPIRWSGGSAADLESQSSPTRSRRFKRPDACGERPGRASARDALADPLDDVLAGLAGVIEGGHDRGRDEVGRRLVRPRGCGRVGAPRLAARSSSPSSSSSVRVATSRRSGKRSLSSSFTWWRTFSIMTVTLASKRSSSGLRSSSSQSSHFTTWCSSIASSTSPSPPSM